jgi:4-hydroxybenzoate polyprenyltransferase
MTSEPTPRNRLRRIGFYLASMFPPAVYVPAGVASYLSLALGLQAAVGVGPLELTWRALPGATSLILLALLLRIYDELKDVETDRRLGAAGDPRYRDRPIVTGAVTVEDIHVLRRWVVAGLFALNLPLGWPLPLAAFLGVFTIFWLSSRWFFCPAISRSLLLAFATHNPLSLATGAYVLAIHVADFGTARLHPGPVALLLIGLWMPLAAWETSRKIRLPEQETDYETYSKVLGWKWAALLPAFFVGLAVAALLTFARQIGLGPLYPIVLALSAAIPVGASLLLRLAPTPGRTRLRPTTEIFATVSSLGLVVALVAERGIGLAGSG